MKKPVGHTCPDGRGCVYSLCVQPGCFRQRLDEDIARGDRWASDAMRTENLPDGKP